MDEIKMVKIAIAILSVAALALFAFMISGFIYEKGSQMNQTVNIGAGNRTITINETVNAIANVTAPLLGFDEIAEFGEESHETREAYTIRNVSASSYFLYGPVEKIEFTSTRSEGWIPYTVRVLHSDEINSTVYFRIENKEDNGKFFNRSLRLRDGDGAIIYQMDGNYSWKPLELEKENGNYKAKTEEFGLFAVVFQEKNWTKAGEAEQSWQVESCSVYDNERTTFDMSFKNTNIRSDAYEIRYWTDYNGGSLVLYNITPSQKRIMSLHLKNVDEGERVLYYEVWESSTRKKITEGNQSVKCEKVHDGGGNQAPTTAETPRPESMPQSEQTPTEASRELPMPQPTSQITPEVSETPVVTVIPIPVETPAPIPSVIPTSDATPFPAPTYAASKQTSVSISITSVTINSEQTTDITITKISDSKKESKKIHQHNKKNWKQNEHSR